MIVISDKLIEKLAIIQLIKCLPGIFDGYDSRLEAALYALSEISKSNKWMIEESQKKKLEKLATSIVENTTIEEEYEVSMDYLVSGKILIKKVCYAHKMSICKLSILQYESINNIHLIISRLTR